MNEKITLPTIIQLLAIRSGDTRKQSEDFIKELLAVISEALTEGEQVKIKDFGVFKTIPVEARKSVNVSTGEEHEIPAHRKVVFVPSKEIADLINAPFAMFETVELSDGVEFEPEEVADAAVVPAADEDADAEERMPDEESVADVMTAEEVSGQADVPDSDEVNGDMGDGVEAESDDRDEISPIYEEVSDEECGPTEAADDDSVADDISADSDDEESGLVYEMDPECEEEADAEPAQSPRAIDERQECPEYDEEYEEDDDEADECGGSSHKFLYGFLSGFGAAAVVAFAVFFCAYYFEWDRASVFGQRGPEAEVDTIVASEPEHIAEVTVPAVDSQALVVPQPADTAAMTEVAPTAPSDSKVYDTITKTRYLTTMAKDHYGNFNLWPYIYKENEAFLGHPDRIRPGTRVVIPPLSKYGVDPSNPADVAKAKRLGVEIYSRYK